MEIFKIRTNEFKKYSPTRKGLVIEYKNEGIIGIVPTTEESSFILLNEAGSKNITDNSDFQFSISDEEDIQIKLQIGEGIKIKIFDNEGKPYRSYLIPVKSSWVVEFRNRRACGKTTVQDYAVFLNLKRRD